MEGVVVQRSKELAEATKSEEEKKKTEDEAKRKKAKNEKRRKRKATAFVESGHQMKSDANSKIAKVRKRNFETRAENS